MKWLQILLEQFILKSIIIMFGTFDIREKLPQNFVWVAMVHVEALYFETFMFDKGWVWIKILLDSAIKKFCVAEL